MTEPPKDAKKPLPPAPPGAATAKFLTKPAPPSPAVPAKPVKPTTLKEQKAVARAAKLKAELKLIGDPKANARIDLAIELFGMWQSRSTIVRALAAGIPAQGIEPITESQGYRYYKKALAVMKDELNKGRAEKAAEHRGRLVGLAKAAQKAGKYADAVAALDRLALLEGTPNPVTAPRTVHVPDGPAPSSDLLIFSDEELATRLIAARAKAK